MSTRPKQRRMEAFIDASGGKLQDHMATVVLLGQNSREIYHQSQWAAESEFSCTPAAYKVCLPMFCCCSFCKKLSHISTFVLETEDQFFGEVSVFYGPLNFYYVKTFVLRRKQWNSNRILMSI